MAKTENNKVQTAEITSELEKLVNNWISYLDEMRFSYLSDIGTKSLSKEHVCAYIQHLPIEEKNDGWPDEVYKKSKTILSTESTISKQIKNKKKFKIEKLIPIF